MPPDVNPLTHSFIPIAFMVGMSVMTGVGILMLSWFLGGGRTSEAGNTIYECGLDPMDEAHVKFPVKFYVVAMIFILFDVEIALLYPWAIFFGDAAGTPATRMLGLVELLVFTGVLVVGYVYLYKAGAFDWVESVRGQQRLKDIARERASNEARERASGAARDGAAAPGRAA